MADKNSWAGGVIGAAMAANSLAGIAGDVVEPVLLAQDLRTSMSQELSAQDAAERAEAERHTETLLDRAEDYFADERLADAEGRSEWETEEANARVSDELAEATAFEASMDAVPALDIDASAELGMEGPDQGMDVGGGMGMDGGGVVG